MLKNKEQSLHVTKADFDRYVNAVLNTGLECVEDIVVAIVTLCVIEKSRPDLLSAKIELNGQIGH